MPALVAGIHVFLRNRASDMFLGLQMDYDLMQRRREIDRDLKTIRPRAA
jgi:hypothetical protein